MKGVALSIEGGRLISRRVKSDGQVLTSTRERKAWKMNHSPVMWRMPPLRRPTHVWFVSNNGETFQPPHENQRVATDVGEFAITPEFLYEWGETSDLRGINIAGSVPNKLLLLAAGSGAAGMVVLYLILQSLGGAGL